MPDVRPLLAVSLAAVALTLVPTRLAFADDLDDDDGARAVSSFSHRHQLGLHAQLGTGYRVLFPYNEEYCGQTNDRGEPKSVCTGRSPGFLDLGLSYGVADAVELLAELRLGLERDFSDLSGAIDGPRPFSIAAGVRLFVDAEGKFKFFSTLEGVLETTRYARTTGAEDATDFGLRNVNGIQFDFHRTFGLYAHFGETVTFATWLRFELHAGVGLQVRFP